jgi:hypothetical protein
VQVAALQAIMALQSLPQLQAPPEEQQGQSSLDQMSQAGPPLPFPPLHLLAVVLQLATRLPGYDNKKNGAPRCNLRDDCDSQLRSMLSCSVTAL